jgi:RNA polymerase sigma factor (sigma-70 family)
MPRAGKNALDSRHVLRNASAAPPAMPPSDSEQARWFLEEVQPHEPRLRAYLHRKFPRLADVDDVVQESYLKICRARIEGRLHSARGFLFTAARNLALDVFRRRRTAPFDEAGIADQWRVPEGGPGAAELASREQELDLLAQAIEALPHRCRQVLKLRKIYGLPHREIAARLGISERTVNVQVGHGVRRCGEFLRARGVALPDEGESP